MEIKNSILLEVTKDKNIYTFSLPVGATFGEAFDVAFEVLNKLLEMQKESLSKSQTSYEATKEVAPQEDK